MRDTFFPSAKSIHQMFSECNYTQGLQPLIPTPELNKETNINWAFKITKLHHVINVGLT